MSKEFREPEDFLSDESFLSWYFGSGREGDSVWETWGVDDPAKRELILQAVALLDASRVREMPLPATQVQQAEAALMQRIGTNRAGTSSPKMHWRWMAAACILVLLGGAMLLVRLLPVRQEQLAAGYGQQLSQELPDGSEVMMNANSRLHYSRNWQEGVDREVWLDGEAFFHVRKTPMKSRFIVHTDRFDIVVTGTKFNVVNRNGKDNVLLQQGSVTIHPGTGEDLHMVPGDYVEWDGARLRKMSVRTDSLMAWQQHQLIFDKTPLRQVATIIEEQYGVKVKLADPSIGDSTISGILRNDNLPVLLQALETTNDYDVLREGGTITIRASIH
jgi:ferric-dicitrate binding protein FerR (iron transport regulator)